jgi:hypothetical protein
VRQWNSQRRQSQTSAAIVRIAGFASFNALFPTISRGWPRRPNVTKDTDPRVNRAGLREGQTQQRALKRHQTSKNRAFTERTHCRMDGRLASEALHLRRHAR